MDPLSDVLRVIRLDGAYFYTVEAADPWSVEAAPARQLSPRIMPTAEHLISYHIMIDGRCFGGLDGEDQVELAPGDVIVSPTATRTSCRASAGSRPAPTSSAPRRSAIRTPCFSVTAGRAPPRWSAG